MRRSKQATNVPLGVAEGGAEVERIASGAEADDEPEDELRPDDGDGAGGGGDEGALANVGSIWIR